MENKEAKNQKPISELMGITMEKVKEMVAADAIIADMKVKKAMELVKEKAVIVPKSEEKSEAESAETESTNK